MLRECECIRICWLNARVYMQDVETAQAMRLLKKERDKIVLSRKMKLRPDKKYLKEKNIMPDSAVEFEV